MERTPITVKSAVETVVQHSKKRTEMEIIPLDKAYGRVLAEPIIAKHDVPPFNRSAYDGYAIRAKDSHTATSENPAHFHVIGEIGAGMLAKKHWEKGKH